MPLEFFTVCKLGKLAGAYLQRRYYRSADEIRSTALQLSIPPEKYLDFALVLEREKLERAKAEQKAELLQTFEREKGKLEFLQRSQLAREKRSFAEVTQRHLYERFLSDFWKNLDNPSDPGTNSSEYEAVRKVPLPHGGRWPAIYNIAKPPPKTALSEAAHSSCPEVRRVIQKILPGEVLRDVPQVPNSLTYGDLSEHVHCPDTDDIYVMKSYREDYKSFIKVLARRYAGSYEEIDDGEADAFEFESE